MNNLFKFWLYLIALSLLSFLLVKWVYFENILVQHSMAYQKNVTPKGDLTQLFSELGLSNGGLARLRPCEDLERHATRYCTDHSVQLLLSDEHAFMEIEDHELRKMLMLSKHLAGEMEMEDENLRKMLTHVDSCTLVTQYIGRICMQENFKKIFKHFALEK